MVWIKTGFILASAVFSISGCGQNTENAQASRPTSEVVAQNGNVQLITHSSNATNGRELFVDKGCVTCHAVNGVGGKAAPALDAQVGDLADDPLEFAARMWRGAPAMIELQSIELGYTIYLTADEISDLAAFSADRTAQKTITLEGLPENIRDGLLDQRFWEMEDWDDFLRSGQEAVPLDKDTPEE